MSTAGQFSNRRGLYEPQYEHDACGVGFLVHLKGQRSHKLIEDALTALNNLNHRGACGCEENTGDGAGVLLQVPHEFYLEQSKSLGIDLPGRAEYGVGTVFLPPDSTSAAQAKRLFEALTLEEGQRFLGWRQVPTNNEGLGATALTQEPGMEQAFVGWGGRIADPEQFERRLYVIRKRFEHAVEASEINGRDAVHLPSLSCQTVVYKGMLTPEQLSTYFPDLHDESLRSALCLFHSRFSTNTLPKWKLAHPYRLLAHNGEINTLRGNINWMRAREHLMDSSVFEPGDLAKIHPVLEDGVSDSATLDNVLELLVRAGRSPAHAMMMLIPEAWEHHEGMCHGKKSFYQFHSCVMEPWDGPASIVFTDGKTIGATLDRNGLRPSRYWVTKDDLVIMASEVGVLDIPPENVVTKGRLEPGRMFLVDMQQGRIVDDEEIKHSISGAKPYSSWLKEHQVALADLPPAPPPPEPDRKTLLTRQMAFGYSLEDEKYILQPMATTGMWAIGSMGTDIPLAVLSDRPQLLYNYFKQLFAQVTNPPLDCIREELVTSVLTNLGAEGNLLEPGPEVAHRVRLNSFVLSNQDLANLKQLDGWRGFRSATLPMLFPAAEGAAGLGRALEGLFAAADRAIEEGANILILSDRGLDGRDAPMPSLLACAGLHNHLIRHETRTRVGLVVESGDAREVHHFCLLLGYGVGAVNPWVAFESIDDMIRRDVLDGGSEVGGAPREGEAPAEPASRGGLARREPRPPGHDEAVRNYTQAVYKGVVKVMAKMGISTIQSYRGAQIFEAIGLNEEFVDRYFTNTSSRVGGLGIAEIAAETLAHHRRAYPQRPVGPPLLKWGGQFQWRRDGEYHLLNPDTIYKLQSATRTGSYERFKQYTRAVNDQSQRLCTLRSLMQFRFDQRESVPLDEVEPVESIVKRFCTGAMSYGSISLEAHQTLAIAMNRLGGWSNTGEGGEDPDRFLTDANGDDRRSRIKQVASGRFGVTSAYLVSADELQIKMAQGAKPGEGGELPGGKVYPWIAKVRHTTPGVGLISPPPHHDIYSIEDLAQLIYDLKSANSQARLSVKLVAEVGVGTVAAGVAKAHADVVLISGHDGGTGASPITSIQYAGIPWELGLAETQQVLVQNRLRDRIVVQTDGQLRTGRDLVIAALLGAEEYGFATSALVVMGCVMMRVCQKDTCPVGVATQNPELRKRFRGDPEHVVNYFRFLAEEVRELLAQLGFRTLEELIGRSDLLDMQQALDHYKAKGLDYRRILYCPDRIPDVAVRKVREQDHGLADALDQELLRDPQIRAILDTPVAVPWCPAVQDFGGKTPVARLSGRGMPTAEVARPIRNVHRAVGTVIGSEITRRYGPAGLPTDTLRLKFTGSAGQSFGAFVPRGMTLSLEGDANDYFGKGLSGGRLTVYPPGQSPFAAERNIVVGNVALYGATSGRAFVRGVAGERFCVRNSGAHAVVEGTGDHGCEYMTGGLVVVLGRTGRNFAAGMSGGVAYVLDAEGDFKVRCNREMVDLEPLMDQEDQDTVQRLLQAHLLQTGSSVASALLENWEQTRQDFVKVMPREYRRALEEAKEAAKKGESEVVTV